MSIRLDSPFLVSFGIPLILLFCGGFAKKLVRGGGWKWADFFLGVEIALSALGSAMVYLYELTKTQGTNGSFLNSKLATTASFIVISFCILLIILSIHQVWEGRNQNPTGQVAWLGIGCNAIGIVLYAIFVTSVRGV
jgi:hypothetical protein